MIDHDYANIGIKARANKALGDALVAAAAQYGGDPPSPEAAAFIRRARRMGHSRVRAEFSAMPVAAQLGVLAALQP